MGQLRSAAVALSPPWLANESPPTNGAAAGVGGRFMYNIGLAGDARLEKLNQGIRARMPTECDASALPIIGNDRVMTQGPGETDDAFRVRLQQAFETWQRAGESRAVLQLISAYTIGLLGVDDTMHVPKLAIVGGYQARKWDWLYADDDPSEPPNHFQPTAQNWSWDGAEATQWWRSWLVLFSYPDAPIATGTDGSIVAGTGNFVELTSPTLPDPDDAPTTIRRPAYVTISGADNPAHNGTFQVVYHDVPHGLQFANNAAEPPDANNGDLTWSLFYYSGIQPKACIGFPGKVIGAGGDTNQAIGVQLPGAASSASASGYFARLRQQLRLWKSAHTFYPAILVSYAGHEQRPSGNSEFSPWTTGAGNPDGTWAHWSKLVNGRYTRARVTSVDPGQFDAVIDGTQLYRRCYVPGT